MTNWLETPITQKLNIPLFRKQTILNKCNFISAIQGSGDWHCESSHFDRQLWTKQMQSGKKSKSIIINVGDTNESITKKDKRFEVGMWSEQFESYLKRHYSTPAKETKKAKSKRYVNCLLNYTVDLVKPYAENIYLWLAGNHNLITYNDLDLDELIVERLNEYLKSIGSEHRIFYGESSAFLKLNFKHSKSTSNQSLLIYAEHSASGNAVVTKGVLESSRKSYSYPCADLILHGHTHTKYKFGVDVVELLRSKLMIKELRSLRCGSYYTYGGYAKRKNLAPLSTGCNIQRFKICLANGAAKFWID